MPNKIFAIGSLRIDSLVIAFLIIFPYFIIHLISDIDTKKKFSNLNKSIHAIKLPLIFTFLGFSCNIFFNKIFFGTYIPHTAIAKKIAYDIKPDFNYFLTQIKSLYFSGALQNSFLLPVPTKYLLFLYHNLKIFCRPSLYIHDNFLI